MAPAESRSWRVDETYIKVRGKWAYLYRAVDKLGNTIDFYLSATRNTKAAKRLLGALRGLKEWEQPEVLNTDKAPAYAAAIAELKAEGKCPKDTHRQKYLNNVVGRPRLKLLRPVRGFKTMKTAYATIKGRGERALRTSPGCSPSRAASARRIVERAFGRAQWHGYRTVWPTESVNRKRPCPRAKRVATRFSPTSCSA